MKPDGCLEGLTDIRGEADELWAELVRELFPIGKAELGGPGSGYFSPKHKGRPGEVGGSRKSDTLTQDEAEMVKQTPAFYLWKTRMLAIWDKATEKQTHAINYYCGANGRPMNNSLKRGDTGKNMWDKDEIKALDSIFEMPEAKAPETFVVFRGSSITPGHIEADDVRHLIQNKMDNPEMSLFFQSPGYVSTTVVPGVAFDFARIDTLDAQGGWRELVWRIDVPKGTKVIPISRDGRPNFAEKEYLFPRNTKIEIHSVRPDSVRPDRRLVIRGRVVSQP